MRALIATGRPEALVALRETERPRPRPGEALVQVEAFSVNHGEMFLLEDRGPGWRPGKDIAGLVVQAAADGTGPAAGQRVTGHAEDGGWAWTRDRVHAALRADIRRQCRRDRPNRPDLQSQRHPRLAAGAIK